MSHNFHLIPPSNILTWPKIVYLCLLCTGLILRMRSSANVCIALFETILESWISIYEICKIRLRTNNNLKSFLTWRTHRILPESASFPKESVVKFFQWYSIPQSDHSVCSCYGNPKDKTQSLTIKVSELLPSMTTL